MSPDDIPPGESDGEGDTCDVQPQEPAREHVGDSRFEEWFSTRGMRDLGTKQLARDAYAAGMADRQPQEPAREPSDGAAVQEFREGAQRDVRRWAALAGAASQPQEPSVADAMLRVRREIREDRGYAWGWQCNVAMAAYDAGCDHEAASRGAARFMRTLFDVDVTTFPEWQDLEAQWAAKPQEPSGRAALAEQGADALRMDWIARQWLDMLSFALVVDRLHDGWYEVQWHPATGGGVRRAHGKTLRAAIDAAMQAEREEGDRG